MVVVPDISGYCAGTNLVDQQVMHGVSQRSAVLVHEADV